MTKLAILGIDNSHAWHFSRTLDPKIGKKYYDDIELIGVYGDYDTDETRVYGVEFAGFDVRFTVEGECLKVKELVKLNKD